MSRATQINVLIYLKLEHGFDRAAFSGIAAAAQAMGDTILHLCSAGGFAEDVDWHLADGAIISSDDPAWLNEVAAAGKPCVNITNFLQGHRQVPVVGNDDESIGRLVAQHYLDRGFRHFAFFDAHDAAYFRPRRDAFIETLRDAGVGCACGPVGTETPPTRARRQWTEHAGRWLDSLPKPLAVMTGWDIDAREAVMACRAANLRVPEDVSVIGVDNDEIICLSIWPHLSSVVAPARRIGFEAARLLHEMIMNGTEAPEKPVLFAAPEIFTRGSSSETAVEDPEVAMAVNFIQSRVAQRLSVNELAKHTAISRRTLERRFVTALGRSPMEEIRRARLEKAKRLLIETDLSLSEVARRSGMGRQQRLCNVLKTETGKTPIEFRSSAFPKRAS